MWNHSNSFHEITILNTTTGVNCVCGWWNLSFIISLLVTRVLLSLPKRRSYAMHTLYDCILSVAVEGACCCVVAIRTLSIRT